MANRKEIIRPKRLQKLLRKLIDIYSPSGKEEQVLAFLQNYLKKHGLPVQRQDLDGNRYNLLVLPAREMDVQLVFIGHVDTVMAYDLENYGYKEDGNLIMGLGSADMKGGCAAMVEAFVAFRENDLSPVPAALALVVGEEEEGDGTNRLIEEYHFPWAIIGEPTNMRPCLSHYSYLEIQIRTYGKQMHASLASRKQNAIEVMLHSVLQLSQYLDSKRPEVVYNIRDLFSSRTGFVVPDRSEAWLDLHLPPSSPLGEIATDLEEVFNRSWQENPLVNGNFRITTIDAGYELPAKGPIIKALRNVYTRRGIPWEIEVFRSHSDANQLWAAGVKPILLGAGRLENAHIPEESVSFRKVCLAASIYSDILIEMASKDV